MTEHYSQASDHSYRPSTRHHVKGFASSYQNLLLRVLDRHLSQGRITFVMPEGTTVVGDPGEDREKTSSDIVVHVNNPDFFRKVLCHGNLGMGESYMAGEFEVEDERLADLLTLLLKNGLDKKLQKDKRFLIQYLGILMRNRLFSKAGNVQRHYDIGDDLFDCFLEDEHQVYSCGYAHSWDDDIDILQRNKLDRICRKLALQPGHRLLDIGSGNGGLLIHAAQYYGVIATGITNSRSHYERTRCNIEKHGLEKQVSVQLGDFSEIEGEYDRVASVGMLEHLPPKEYAVYFKKIASVLAPDGWSLVHAIGLNAAENKHDPFIQKYIFPGSDTPSLSAFSSNIEHNDMAIIDVENIVRHYAVTTQRWLESFRKNRDQLDGKAYDGVFKRMWEYYLSCGIAAALAGNLAVYQVLFTKDYHAQYRFQRV